MSSTMTTIAGGATAVAGTPAGSDTPGTEPAAEAGIDAGAAAAAAATPDPYVNPQLQIDPDSGTVILQYRDDAGKVVRQVPSEYELRSYQLGQHAAKPADR